MIHLTANLTTNLTNKVDLSHRIILITGATGAIGQAVSKTLFRQGADLVLLARNAKKLEHFWQQFDSFNQTQDSATKSVFTQPSLYPLDLAAANENDYLELAQIVESEYGRLDGIIHVAATLGNLSPLNLYDRLQWYKVMQTNLNSAFLLTHACYPLLQKSDHARVIFTSSGVAQHSQAYWGAYAISKRAVDWMMQQFSTDAKNQSISFCSFNPGPVASPMRAKAFPGEQANQLTKPEVIADYYLSLLMTNAEQIDGKVLTRKDFSC